MELWLNHLSHSAKIGTVPTVAGDNSYSVKKGFEGKYGWVKESGKAYLNKTVMTSMKLVILPWDLIIVFPLSEKVNMGIQS